MLPPSKIAGTKIAFGRATWVYDDEKDGEGHYNFVEEDSFRWILNQQTLVELGIDEEDLLDCVMQAEEQLGSPEEYRPALGLLPQSGLMNIGATFVSKSNKGITCVFTPTSMNHPTTSALAVDTVPPDAYFEWYYTGETEEVDSLEKFLQDFDAMSGARTTNTISPITVPGYEEAAIKTANLMESGKREVFLQKIWNYHKTPTMIPYVKEQLKEELVGTWNSVLRVERALSMYGEKDALRD